jgi:hypothetical protein
MVNGPLDQLQTPPTAGSYFVHLNKLGIEEKLS